MIRALPLLFSAILLVACGPDSDKPPVTDPGTQPDKTTAEPKTGTAPVTGSPMFREVTEAIGRDVQALEKRGRPTEVAELAAFEREVGMTIKHVEVTLLALDVSIVAESRQIAEKNHKALLLKRTGVDKIIDGTWREITEIRDLLKASAKGTDEIPPGFTEDELKDRLADLEEVVRTQRGKLIEINNELDVWAKVIDSKETPPEQGATTLTQERDILEGLRKRARKLLEK